MKPDPATCRWLDRLFGDVCRNRTTHPSQVLLTPDESAAVAKRMGRPWKEGVQMISFVEPPCRPCDECGYQPITPRTPAWDDPGDGEKEKTK